MAEAAAVGSHQEPTTGELAACSTPPAPLLLPPGGLASHGSQRVPLMSPGASGCLSLTRSATEAQVDWVSGQRPFASVPSIGRAEGLVLQVCVWVGVGGPCHCFCWCCGRRVVEESAALS